ncbi:hypothetical protein TTHERM_00288000 (macronuclear) [Tetrahymena thermophila SB210]|uniref:Uncharacterized protein n=1 Tax=Tetrahymena thermophila (strain SB210) TaxID=312017 RepID=I7M8K8_TETTS|nr:hypothetical protein TTHERM_00288000 [Tetrahymena thermophila SB210]EAR98371.1 hypothetical protein TTHERM_00288000 [Tetrahymena thermophila SB210]|eukprot:XP_001018616.1 hypothetical protein TTHERM_00288000 [Tetrahymena thermophila SB210]
MGNSQSGYKCKPYKTIQEITQEMNFALSQSSTIVKQFLQERENFRKQFNENILEPHFECTQKDLVLINNYYTDNNKSFLIKKMGKIILKQYIDLIDKTILECIQILDLAYKVIEKISISKTLINSDIQIKIEVQNQTENLSQNISNLELFLFQYIDYQQITRNQYKNRQCIQDNHKEVLISYQSSINTFQSS